MRTKADDYFFEQKRTFIFLSGPWKADAAGNYVFLHILIFQPIKTHSAILTVELYCNWYNIRISLALAFHQTVIRRND